MQSLLSLLISYIEEAKENEREVKGGGRGRRGEEGGRESVVWTRMMARA